MTSKDDEGSLPVDSAEKDRASTLEARYIKLLEFKIEQLEAQISDTAAKASKAGVKPPSSHAGEDHEEDDASDISGEAMDPVPQQSEHEDEPRYKTTIRKWDPKQGDFFDVDATKKEEEKPIGPENKSPRAFTFRKLIVKGFSYRRDSESYSSEVEIEFEPLQRLLGSITSKWGWSEKVTSCRSPYTPLIHAWDKALGESREIPGAEEEENQARKDLGELLRILSTSSGYLPLDQYFKDRHAFSEEDSITHSALFTLFPPGTHIVSHVLFDEPQVFSVQSSDGFKNDGDTFSLICYSFDWNGTEFNRVPYQMQIPYWGLDRRSIVELPFYPLSYYVDAHAEVGTKDQSVAKLEGRLIARGKKFVEYCKQPKGQQMFKYKGDAHFHTGRSLLHRVESKMAESLRSADDSTSTSGTNDASNTHGEQRTASKNTIDGTTIVDFASYYEYLSTTTPILGPLTRYEGQLETLSPERRANPDIQNMYKFGWDKHPRDKKMTPEQYMMCPPRVLGYALKQKKWAQLLVDKLDAPNAADATTFTEKLQLDDEAKALVEKSVRAHERGKKEIKIGQTIGLQDFAPDKGKGLIILLYGYPGVGKTLTAESVALMAGKPLLSVGVSDIGTESDKVEANLEKIFDLAGKWEAVLLFDEADVFLESRNDGERELQRNAMVSVLLRVLEYYDGILILTTNRMRSFDIAVQSRIHIAIRYGDLSPEQQRNIYKSFIDQLCDKDSVEDVEDVMKWVKKTGCTSNFNGRQIRNIVSTAMGIALMSKGEVMEESFGRKGKGKLNRIYLGMVAKQTKSFKDDLAVEERLFKKENTK